MKWVKEMNEKKRTNIIILLGLGILLILSIFFLGKIFGSNIDWLNQHVAFADYFRKLFYHTGELIPNIAWNLGLGQNIYYFSYYGLLNPFILISYLLPFVSMFNYTVVMNAILYLLSIYLFYKWVSTKFDNKLTFFLTFIFMCSSPLFYHFHRQVMFVNYLPFLLLSLLEIDKNRKYSLCFLTIFITLIIFTSYYYSVGSILCIIVYYVYVYFKEPVKKKMKIVIPVIISLMLSGILIVPTLYTILSGRSSIQSEVSILNLFLPNFSFGDVLYGSYTLGLTAIVVPSIVSLFIDKKKKNRFLGIILSILILFPIFRYLLNGGLYIRSKALIPFLPLYILGIGIFIKSLFNREIDFSLLVKITLIITVISLLTGYLNIGYYLDLLLTLVLISLCYQKRNYILLILILVEVFTMFVVFNLYEDYVTRNDFEKLYNYEDLVEEIIQNDNTFYRLANTIDATNTPNLVISPKYFSSSLYSSTYNSYYYNFYHNTLNSNNDSYNHLMHIDTNNIIAHRLFGIKYVLSKEELGWGYRLLKQDNDYYVYENLYPLSLGYATNRLYSIDYFNTLEYPYHLELLLTGIVTNYSNVNYPHYTNKISDGYSIVLGDYISVSNAENHMILEVMNDSNIAVKFSEPIKDKMLLIAIEGLEENSCNTVLSIKIDNNSNTLTCKEWNYPNKNNTFHFLINRDDVSSLNVEISKGTYKITNIGVYTIDNDIFNTTFDYMTNIMIEDNQINGNIHVTNDGYMALSIPYDEGFKIEVDDKIVDYEEVNGGFIGFKVTRGYHKIRITYESPYYQLGLVISILGIVSLITVFLWKTFINSVDN